MVADACKCAEGSKLVSYEDFVNYMRDQFDTADDVDTIL